MAEEHPQPPTHNQPEFTVSEISAALKRTVEEAYGHVRVRGEVSGFKRATSGHCYFSLKDENAVLSAVCWRGVAGSLPFKPEDGLEVVCVGKISTYPGRSNYQIVVEYMEPAGVGALMALLEKRKKELAAEGLFDEARKQALPFLPRTIGVVTSPTGAVIRDILHRLSDRFPVHVLVWPVLVQGEGAAEQVAEAIAGFNGIPHSSVIPAVAQRNAGISGEDGTRSPHKAGMTDMEAGMTGLQRPDLLIVARGGGSLEDLWAFNEEIVVRAVAASEIPLISAVGHETDTTLIDYVADKRAPTPTAAAELAVPVRGELLAYVKELDQRHFSAVQRFLEERMHRLEGLARGLTHPKVLIENRVQRLDDWGERLQASLPNLVEKKAQKLTLASAQLRPTLILQKIKRYEERVASFTRLLDSYHYQKVLARGFALVRDSKEKLVTSAGNVTSGAAFSLEFSDGTAQMVGAGGKPPAKKPKKSPKKQDDKQGALF